MVDEANTFGAGEFGGDFGPKLGTDAKSIITNALRMTGVNPENAAYREVALSFLNEAYLTILKGRHWKFLNRELFVELQKPYSTGTLAIEEGSHTVKEEDGLSVVNFNVNHLGQLLQIGTSGQYYRVLDIVSNKELKINSGYVGDTTDSVGFKIYQDRITLDGKVQDVKSVSVIGHREIMPDGLQTFRTRKSRNNTLSGTPIYFTVIEENPQDGAKTLEFYPCPDDHYSLHIEYTERPTYLSDSETDFVSIPPEHIDVLTLSLRAKIYEDQNNTSMAASVGRQASMAWSRMAGDKEMTDSTARIQLGKKYFNRRRSHRGYYGRKYFGRVDD